MLLHEIGALLKAERERQGVSVSEMMERTKISRANLMALENGDDSHLPHPVYLKGFVRNYARELGLEDPEGLSRALSMDAPEVEPPTAKRGDENMGHIDDVATRSLPVVPLLLALMVGLGVAAYLLVGPGGRYESLLQGDASTDVREEFQAEPAQTPGQAAPGAPAELQPEVPAEQPAPQAAVTGDESQPEAAADVAEAAPEAAPEPVEEAAPEPSAQAATAPAASETESGTPPSVVPVTPATAEAQPALQGADTEEEPQGSMRVAVITATAECWTLARTGDGRQRTRVLQPGQTMTMEFRDSLMIRLGNSGGATITLDGEPFPFNGAPGVVRTIRLP